jgi:hypothetical protein
MIAPSSPMISSFSLPIAVALPSPPPLHGAAIARFSNIFMY